MAKLLSEDNECPSWLELRGVESKLPENESSSQIWQTLTLSLRSGKRNLAETCLICRSPEDEIAKLSKLLEDLLESRRDRVRFEPAEPSFELSFELTHNHGVKAEIWFDSGNADTGFYRWDAAGVRFYTTLPNLLAFKRRLDSEFF